ncbi:MAG: DUF4399 domain-containing protein [Gemmatimonadaceae bacterium]|nr:DUF4399 domain-containing protein [Gemmatimonadaceae bacterium]
MRRRRAAFAVPVALLALAATLDAQAAPAPAAAASAAAAPRIYLRTPANGAVVRGKVTIAFGLQNYGVAPAGIDFPNAGHFHLLIDAEPPAPGTAVLGDFQHRVISTDLVSAPVTITVR